MWRKRFEALERFGIIAIGGFMLWPNAFPPILLALIVSIRLVLNPRSLIPTKGVFFLMIPALVLAVSWFSTGLETSGFKEIELWALALGIFLYFHSDVRNHRMLLFQKSFVVFSLLQALFLLTYLAFTDPFSSDGFGQHLRDAIDQQFHVHPTYLTTAWCWALFLIWFRLPITQAHQFWLSFLFLAIIALTGGKMPLVALAIISILAISQTTNLNLTKKLAVLGAILLIGVGATQTPVLQERISELRDLDLSYSEGQWLSSTELRLGVWACSIECIKHNTWFGVGVGNTRHTLENCYNQYNQSEFFEGEYNTHNQYMHFWLASGLIGLAFLLVYFVYITKLAADQQQKLVLYFLVYFLVISLTENYFSRQLGIMLFAFFAAPLLHSFPSRKAQQSRAKYHAK